MTHPFESHGRRTHCGLSHRRPRSRRGEYAGPSRREGLSRPGSGCGRRAALGAGAARRSSRRTRQDQCTGACGVPARRSSGWSRSRIQESSPTVLASRYGPIEQPAELRLQRALEVLLHLVDVGQLGEGPAAVGAEVVDARNPVSVSSTSCPWRPRPGSPSPRPRGGAGRRRRRSRRPRARPAPSREASAV